LQPDSQADRRFRHDAPAPAGASWRPILQRSEGERALEAIDRLLSVSASPEDGGRADPSLSGGSAGVAVLYAELERAGALAGASDLAARELEGSIETLAKAPLGASLFAGFTGVAWAADVVSELLGGGEDLNEEIDEALLRTLARVDWERAPYDLIMGLTGLGVYALERWPRPAATEALARVAGELGRLAGEDEHGTYWFTAPELLLGSRREQYPAGGVDLGVAHGVAAVIPFLARVQALAAADVKDLVAKSVQWLLAHALETGAGPTIPYYVAPGVEPMPARLAWCYGDPGVAATLLLAAEEAQQPAWADAATRIALGAAERPPDESGVVDAGFCHGSAGLAHLFNRAYQATGEPRLLEAALFWLDDTLARVAAVADAARGAEHSAWNGRGLLEGAAGIALVLLAAATPVEPAWDRMFLVSARA